MIMHHVTKPESFQIGFLNMTMSSHTMATQVLSISGCSHECFKEVVEPQCCPGYWGVDCIECPQDAERPCSNNGVCSEGMGGNGTCSCKPGFVGTACEDCADNLYGPTCSSACKCVHGLCSAGIHGDGKCTCFSGYKGQNCDLELPECSALQCPENTRCIQSTLDGSLRCQCLPGYQTLGNQCISINPCMQQVCHVHATCAHVGPSKHLCTCAQGYSGDGHVCVPIDPCQTNLGGCSDDSAHCVYDGPGKSHCECQDGFDHLAGGVSCSLKDACRPDSCSKNARCSTVEPNVVECTCHKGYLGNGKICYGNIMQRLNDLNTEPGGQWTGQLSNAITFFGTISWPLSNLGPFTVFVPVNKGFKGTPLNTLMADQLKYLCNLHIVAGEMPYDTLKRGDIYYTLTGKSGETVTTEDDKQLKIRIHGSRKKGGVLQSDVIASNGIIHIINKLMDSVSPTVESNKKKTGVDLVLKGNMPSTIFAPTNTAFDAMKEGQLDYLRSMEVGNVVLRVYTYKLRNLDVYNAVSSHRARTMANHMLSFNVSENGQLLVNGIAVLEADVEANYGCLYSLDGVVIPPSIEPILPHRCDITESKLVRGNCVSCMKVTKSTCPSGVSTTQLCCKGFYGPDCSPCPGGFNNPCSGHGQCSEGIEGNGTCVCETNFKGSRCHYCSDPNKYGPACTKTCECIHGMCDNRPEADGRCKIDSCKLGYTGQYCERQTKPCGPLVTFCHAHAECDFNGGQVKCVCKPGFQGDGITCEDTDPCALPYRGGCDLNAKCIKTGPGSHTCQCLAGWRADEDGCQPINDCLGPDRGGCHPNATCIYVGPGQSGCACNRGFRGNGMECVANNPCVTQYGGCHYLASCLYISGAWKCVCDDGYTGNGEVCYGTVGQVSKFKVAVSDYLGTDIYLPSIIGQNITVLVPSTAAVDKMNKEDKDYWTTQGNLPMIGGATITTANVASTNGMIHIIDRVLVPERGLSEGLLELLGQRPVFSLFRSFLILHNLTDEIEQASAYTVFAPTDSAILEYLKNTALHTMDLNTTRYHIVLSERLMSVDLQGGTYKESMLGFSYQLGILPRDGKLFVNEAQVNVSDIQSGKGVIHGLSAVLEIIKNRCDNQQIKTFQTFVRKKCMFSRVFQGERLLSIGCRTICKNTTIMRNCCGGFYGEQCEQCPGPKGQPCYWNGVCQDGTNGTGVCQCSKGFSGTACETCQEGKYGIHCDQDCKCENGRCNDGIHGDGTCECDAYWRGVTCNESTFSMIAYVAFLLFIICILSAVCKNWNNACKDNNGGCSSHALCKRTLPGRRQCVCITGYHGDGMVCVLSGSIWQKNGECHRYARCNMTGPGERSCECMDGYVGNGITCKGTVGSYLNPVFVCDLTMSRNLTTLTGDVFCSSLQGTILINNKVKVVHSDDPSTNGIIHEIDTVMIPENLRNFDETEEPVSKKIYNFQNSIRCNILMNLTDVADHNGYKTFYKLLEVMDMVNDPFHQPITIFLPSDQAMAALPQKQKDFLYDPQNQGHLLEYLTYHIIRDTKVYAAELVHMDPIRTLQGSELKASCGGMDKIGEIFFNNGNCRIIQRHLPFIGGIAYGIDCLLDPPSLGGRCDKKGTVDIPELKKCDLPTIVSLNKGCQSICTFVLWQPKCCDGFYGRDCLVCPGGNSSPCFNRGKCDDGHLGNGNCTCDAGFQGDACELCTDGHYGPDCKVCNCTEHGSCEDGIKGSGSCFCDQGWTGQHCETQLALGPVCSQACSPNGVCKENNTCVCKPYYEGDGLTCTVANLCKYWNGGCVNGATCSQKGVKVICTCPKGHSGDGFFCQPIDPCSVDDNGGCHEHATCTMTGPGKKKCACKDNYIGDGKTCEVKELPLNRCLQENGQCHSDAQCTDLHYEDSTVGVFHFRSTKGQYKLNYTSAQDACTGEDGIIATYTQLSYAQQAGFNLCAAGWLDQARVAYPTTYSNPKCGFGHVGIVDYGVRSNLSETWDAFCYRVKEVKCECKTGYIGDGYSCTGTLLQVLTEKPTFSNFLSQILNYSQISESGKQYISHLSNLTIQSTLFVPDNTGLYQNQTLTHRDIEYHLAVGRALALKDLTNGSRIRTRLGQSLTSSSRYINDRFIIDSDILASNGIIHVLQGPLKAPPSQTVAGMGIGVVLLIILMAGAGFVGYHFYTHNTKPFQFHYFKVSVFACVCTAQYMNLE
uniref:Stabilin 2 n=1 Tax=Esox lucius TaxID=8010 RepID=A0A3P8ZT82_ESOLU